MKEKDVLKLLVKETKANKIMWTKLNSHYFTTYKDVRVTIIAPSSVLFSDASNGMEKHEVELPDAELWDVAKANADENSTKAKEKFFDRFRNE